MKCIDILERENVLESIWERGQDFFDKMEKIVQESDVPATASGIPPMPYITFDKVDDQYKERRRFFYTETIRRGLFIQPYHHGYICHRHTEQDLKDALGAIEEALKHTHQVYPQKK